MWISCTNATYPVVIYNCKMSIPKRHHYVPRVHIRKFKKGAGYFLLLKDKKEVKNSFSSADFFVKKQLNTTGLEDGGKDHFSFENELTIRWDNNFNTFYTDIINNQKTPNKINNKTLKFFFEYSVITFMRRLKMEDKFNNDFLSFKDALPEVVEVFNSNEIDLSEFTNDAIDSVKNLFQSFSNELNKLEEKQKGVDYPALIPSEAKMFVPEKCHCIIYITSKDSFILPDCTMTALKSKETFDLHGMTVNKIAQVGIPLTPKLFIEIRNSDLIDAKENLICIPSKKEIEEINNSLFNIAYTQVLLNNPEQLDELKESR